MPESEELIDETGAIEAIYPECIEKLGPGIYKFKVPQHEHIIFQMSFPEQYPDEKPCVLDVISEKEGFDEKYLMELFQEVLDSIYTEGEDEEHDILDDQDHWNAEDGDIKDLSAKFEQSGLEENNHDNDVDDAGEYEDYVYDETAEKAKMTSKKRESKVEKEKKIKPNVPLAGWVISEPITDRKSTFVAFAKEVHSLDEAYQSFAELMEDKKCGRANHAMRAWRIKDKDSGAQYQDCDDDGETAAGGRMLHLMTIMNAWNVMVVCCRWFGGVHIGPDRFKHINSATRDSLVKGNFVALENDPGKKTKKKK